MAKRLTLFGSFARSNPANTEKSYIYKSPVSRYECFVERYFQRNRKTGKSWQQIVTEAQELWKDSDEGAKKKSETLLPGGKLFKCDKTTEDPSSHRKCGEGWFRRVTSSDTKESSSQSADVIITGLESGQSSSGARVCVSF